MLACHNEYSTIQEMNAISKLNWYEMLEPHKVPLTICDQQSKIYVGALSDV